MTLWNTVSPYIFSRHRPLSVAANTASPDVFVVAKIQNSTHACTQSQRRVQTLLQVMSCVHAVHCYSTFQATLNMPRVQYVCQRNSKYTDITVVVRV